MILALVAVEKSIKSVVYYKTYLIFKICSFTCDTVRNYLFQNSSHKVLTSSLFLTLKLGYHS